MEINEKAVLRKALDDVMKKNELNDNDMEEVESGLYYSRGVRTLCVLDPRFDEQIDMLPALLEKDKNTNPMILSQTYDTLYGQVTIRQNGDKKLISLSDNENGNKRNKSL